jgi:hypothetical protein
MSHREYRERVLGQMPRDLKRSELAKRETLRRDAERKGKGR